MNKLIAIFLLCTTYVSAQTVCDSVSYSIGEGQTLTLIGTNHSSDSVTFMWGVCDTEQCYSASGDVGMFPHINRFDTIKVCYDLSPVWMCDTCQYVLFVNGVWQPVNTVTHVNELNPILLNNKIYDLLGRELKFLPKGIMYIKNNRIYKWSE